MPKMLFISLPVADVAKATAFYQAIGFEKNEAFSNPQASSMAWSDAISVNLLDHALFSTFTSKAIMDARTMAGALFALSFDSREAVDAISAAAIAAGGRELHGAEDEGFMYSRAFEDLDGYGWGPMWMDVTAMTTAMSAPQEEAAA